MLGKTSGSGSHEQKIFVRVYGYPQKTNKVSFYKIQAVMFAAARKFAGSSGVWGKSLVTKFDDMRGEYLELKISRPKRGPTKDMILWLDYRR